MSDKDRFVKDQETLIDTLKGHTDTALVIATLKRLAQFAQDGSLERNNLWARFIGILTDRLQKESDSELFWQAMAVLANQFVEVGETSTNLDKRGYDIVQMIVSVFNRLQPIMFVPTPLCIKVSAVASVVGMGIQEIPGALDLLIHLANEEAYGAYMREEAIKQIAGSDE